MIILRQNFVNTTTQGTTTNGTATLANLFDRNKSVVWTSDNAGTDATAATLRIIFDTTQTVSQIILLGINLKNFAVHPNTNTADFTAAISETTNSATSLYYSVATNTTVKELVITMTSTIVANAQKEIGELIVTNLLYNFTSDRLPAARHWKPKLYKKQIVHEMSDGGSAIYNIRNKYQTEIEMDFVPTSTVDTLRTVYDLGTPFVFVPFETTTSWIGDLAECVWPGDFEFYQYSDNVVGNGYRGKMRIRQTPGGTF